MIGKTTFTVHAADKAKGMTPEEIRAALEAANPTDVVTVTTSWAGKIRTITVVSTDTTESASNDPETS